MSITGVAYESALAMLSETGKAAVIHPTGTAKRNHQDGTVYDDTGRNKHLCNGCLPQDE